MEINTTVAFEQAVMLPWSRVFYSSRSGRLFHRRRLERCLDVCRSLEATEVLEVGCCDMVFYQLLGRVFRRYVGVDPSPHAAELCRQLQLPGNVAAYQIGAESLPFRDQSFDLVLSFETIEHVSDEDRVIAEIVRVLKPGGRVVISIPIEFGLLLPLKVLARRILRGAREYKLAELWHATLGRRMDRVKRDQHKGYDARETVARFCRLGLSVERIHHLPLAWLPNWLGLGMIVELSAPGVTRPSLVPNLGAAPAHATAGTNPSRRQHSPC